MGGKAKKFLLRREGSRKKRVGAGKEIWKQRRKQRKQEEARGLVGVDFLGQKHKPKRALKKSFRNA